MTISTSNLLVTAGKNRTLTALKATHARLCSLLGRERKRKECDGIFWSLFSGLFVHFLAVTRGKTNNAMKRGEMTFSSRRKPSYFVHGVFSCVHFASVLTILMVA